jgi:hypothetical protein
MKRSKAVTEIHRTNLNFLLKLKGATGILNNLIHDNLALMAIAKFKSDHPTITCAYTNAGASGIDILGKEDSGVVTLIAEVKTTLPDLNGRIRGPQQKQIKKDLDRLTNYKGDAVHYRYLVLLSASTERAIRKQLKTETAYGTVTIINAFQEELLEPEHTNDDNA